MSAFFVGADHVNAILSYVNLRRDNYVPAPHNEYGKSNDFQFLTDIGKQLLSENIKSLQSRYASDWHEMVDLDVNQYVFQLTPNPSAIEVIKLCHCLDYQSCEHDGWEASYAKKFLTWVTDTAISNVPGYDKAAWHYEAA